MKYLAGLAATIGDAFRRYIAPLLRSLFGKIEWTPPEWLPRAADALRRWFRRAFDWLNAQRTSHPKGFWTTAASLLILIVGGYAGWRWYENLPEPYYLQVTVSRPNPTPLDVPNALPDPVVVQFTGSAAKLSEMGKAVTSGITVTPTVDGSWRWSGDARLIFTPAKDWAIGQDYTITLDRSLFPSHVLLKDYSYSFRSPDFGAWIQDEEFYEDPTNPKIKQVVATVRFTHPVDKADFEKRISFRMRIEPVKSFNSSDAKSFGYKVTYDTTGGKAFIHSDSFGIPNDEAEMLLWIAKGVRSSLGGPGTDQPLERTVQIPGIETYFRIAGVSANEVANDQDEMDSVGTIEATAPMRQSDLAKYVTVYLLPKDKPAIGDEKVQKNYEWSSGLEAVPEVMALAKPVAIEWNPTELEFSKTQSFKYTADSGRFLLVTIRKGVKSFGDYLLVKDYAAVIGAPAFPPAVKVVSQGSILSLSGEKKISILTRNVPGIKIEISRLLPGSVSHLVSQTNGTFSNPSFWRTFGDSSFDFDDLSEVFKEVRRLPAEPSGKNQYNVFDFGQHLANGALPHGLFYFKVQGWNPANDQPMGTEAPQAQYYSSFGRRHRQYQYAPQPQATSQEYGSDERLVLLTDLGMVVKDSADGSHDVFVQSIQSGEPLANVTVQMLGKNGLPVFSSKTDVNGRASFPSFNDFKREKTPTVYVAETDNDFSFLPYQRADRQLNLSRFDTGGLYTQGQPAQLQAFLFSDRGIYRPGDDIHIGVVVKQMDWKPLPDGLPLQMVETDPRGIEIRNRTIKFSSVGFEDFSTSTQADSLTGSYDFTLYIVDDTNNRKELGSASVRVEEFQPDRMTIKAQLSTPPAAGWIPPDALSATVNLRTLFGTAAVGRKVKASFKLTPSGASFEKYPDYLFVDPYNTKQSYDEDLGEMATDANGDAKFDFNLERFEKGLYRLRFIAEGFEPEGGRSVVTDADAVVSPAPYLVAYKPDGDLAYIDKDSTRNVHLIAVDPKLDKVAAKGLSIELVELRYVSVLTQQENGTLAYQSVRKEILKWKNPLDIPVTGLTTNLPTQLAGSYVLVIRNDKDVELNRISFEVVGHANVARSLEREAELKIKLNKPEYAPGEEAELEIQAPYVGGGLITVERDHIYNVQWFKTTTTESVQKIKIPEELEGNGYVTVTFLRSLDSKEIYTSPLSYGSVPLTISRTRHLQGIKIDTPKLVRPGDTLKIGYQTTGPAKLVLIAVDEGILQVARYHTPDPLSYFFRKRALEVGTSQILDLVLPELHLLNEPSATGGDQEGLMARSHNPFKRKGQKPVAFWSGIIDSDGKPSSIGVPIPDYFNGTVRVMAIAVSDSAIGVVENKVVSQGYFVIQPQAPYFATPGDRFEVTALVANNTGSKADNSNISVKLDTDPGLEVLSDTTVVVPIPTGTDTTVHFQVRAKPIPGAANMTFEVAGAGKHASYTLDMSVRPASPYVTTVTSGYVKKSLIRSVKADVPLHRQMFPQLRTIEVSASSFPLGLAYGLMRYLAEYPYGCTEQLVSQAFPAVVLGSRPELGLSNDKAAASIARAIATLEARQNADGAFGLWSAGGDVVPFVSVYATHFLLEAREHGFDVPPVLLDRALKSLRSMTATPGSDSETLRAQAYALYVLADSGVVVADRANALRAALDQNDPDSWHSDITALYLAATYQLMRMDSDASRILYYVPTTLPSNSQFDTYCDDLVYRSAYLYLMSKHFPDRAKKIGGDQILRIADDIDANRQNTISSAYALLAIDAYARAAGSPQQSHIAFSAKMPDGKMLPLAINNQQFAIANVPAEAKSVHVEGDTDLALFYQLTEAGFDVAPPTTEIKNRVEVFREFDDESDAPESSAGLESKVDVKMSVRAIDSEASNVAIVDMIPGGFEVDISPEGLGNRESGATDATTWKPDFIDVREDRVVFYGTVGTDAQTFSYRLRPTNRGTFAIPPLYLEGMYDRTIQARSLGGTFTIGDKPAPKSP